MLRLTDKMSTIKDMTEDKETKETIMIIIEKAIIQISIIKEEINIIPKTSMKTKGTLQTNIDTIISTKIMIPNKDIILRSQTKLAINKTN